MFIFVFFVPTIPLVHHPQAQLEVAESDLEAMKREASPAAAQFKLASEQQKVGGVNGFDSEDFFE